MGVCHGVGVCGIGQCVRIRSVCVEYADVCGGGRWVEQASARVYRTLQ